MEFRAFTLYNIRFFRFYCLMTFYSECIGIVYNGWVQRCCYFWVAWSAPWCFCFLCIVIVEGLFIFIAPGTIQFSVRKVVAFPDDMVAVNTAVYTVYN